MFDLKSLSEVIRIAMNRLRRERTAAMSGYDVEKGRI